MAACSNTKDATPRDGPALVFDTDPHIRKITHNHGEPGSEFGLVLVAGWPPNLDRLGAPYFSFLNAVRGCFDESDLAGGDPPAVYLYPSESLHVTVATLHAFALGTPSPDERSARDDLVRSWTGLVDRASQRSEWPKRTTLRFRIKSAQIGRKAGILLWEETTGGLHAVRSCIAAEVEAERNDLESRGIDAGTLSVPLIAHSTFLRFGRNPSSEGEDVQAKFATRVLPWINEWFASGFEVDVVRLVCERTPYMHIPCDKNHLLREYPLN